MPIACYHQSLCNHPDPVAQVYIRNSQNGNTLHKLSRNQAITGRSYFSDLPPGPRCPRPQIGFEN